MELGDNLLVYHPDDAWLEGLCRLIGDANANGNVGRLQEILEASNGWSEQLRGHRTGWAAMRAGEKLEAVLMMLKALIEPLAHLAVPIDIFGDEADLVRFIGDNPGSRPEHIAETLGMPTTWLRQALRGRFFRLDPEFGDYYLTALGAAAYRKLPQ
jgi:hypothetical protein